MADVSFPRSRSLLLYVRYIDTILILAGESRESYKYFTVVFESVSISPRVVGQMKRGISLE